MCVQVCVCTQAGSAESRGTTLAGQSPPFPRPCTHGNRQRGSRRHHRRSPCRRRRASARARTHRCPGTGRTQHCRSSGLGTGGRGQCLLLILGLTSSQARCPRCHPPAALTAAPHSPPRPRRRTQASGPPPPPAALTAVGALVGAVPAVVGAVAHPQLRDAAVVLALKLHGVAELVCGGDEALR